MSVTSFRFNTLIRIESLFTIMFARPKEVGRGNSAKIQVHEILISLFFASSSEDLVRTPNGDGSMIDVCRRKASLQKATL